MRTGEGAGYFDREAASMAVSAAFFYHRALSPMMWALVALGALELFVVHWLVSIWSVTAAATLSVLTAGGIVWMVLLIRSFGAYPVIVDRAGIWFRTGHLLSMRIALDDIEAVRTAFAGEALKRPGLLNFAMLSYPNILVDLGSPVRRGRREVRAIAHCLDDPAGFAAAVGRQLTAGSTG